MLRTLLLQAETDLKDVTDLSRWVAGVGAEGAWAAVTGAPEGIGVDPVFQLYSYLWDIDLYGEEPHYYNMAKVIACML